MKDITRIHIAKVAYDIELPAKKKLEAYIVQLEAYAQDSDVLEDIEIRITELLQEKGVKQNDVITAADVTSVCAQLGDPKEFMADGDVVSEAIDTSETRKRLYRNTDTALVGGVLSGVASYFGINPMWTRLAFVLLTFISLGFSLFIYVVFWFIIPAAKTAAEKLSMSGRPVTLSSIRQLNELEVTPNTTPRIVKRVATLIVGLLSVLGVLGIIAGGIYSWVAVNQVARDQNVGELISYSIGSSYPLTIALGGLAAATLVVFLILVAYASFKQVFGKRIWVTGAVLIVLGLTSFGAAIGSAAYGSYNLSMQAAQSLVTEQSSVPKGFESITSFSVKDGQDTHIDYIVDSNPRLEVITATNDKVSITVDGDKATLNYIQGKKNDIGYRYDMSTLIRVYGPALTSIDADAAYVAYQGGAQDNLSVKLAHNASVATSNETHIEALQLTASGSSSFEGQASTIGKVVADISSTSVLRLGTVASLTVKAPTTCAVNARTEVYAVKVNAGFVTFNDNKIFNTQYEDSCTMILSAGDMAIDGEYPY